MHWIIAAPFISERGGSWLEPFVPDTRYRFLVVPARYAHDRSRTETSGAQWRDYFSHGNAVWSAHKRMAAGSGVITLFPQLALTVGLRKRLSLRPTPLVAWTFNLGSLRRGLKRNLSRFALRAVDRFIVHSRREITSYSEWLDLPAQRFQFVPLQRPTLPIRFSEDRERPFVLSMGSAQRDYRLFFEVMAELAYPTVVVAGPQSVAGLTVPRNVTLHHNLTIEQCHELAQKARINVVPIDNPQTASGQVSLIDAMMYGRPTVATRSIGTEDYVEHGETGMLVAPGDPDAMRDSIAALWDDAPYRDKLGSAARAYVEQTLSDEAAGRQLAAVLREFDSRPDDFR